MSRRRAPFVLAALSLAAACGHEITNPMTQRSVMSNVEVGVDAAALTFAVQYNGADAASYGTDGCMFVGIAERPGAFAQTMFCAPGTINPLPPGEAQVSLRWTMGSSTVLGGPEAVTLPAGVVTTKTFDISGVAGIVKAEVLLNGQVPANSQVCIKSPVPLPGPFSPSVGTTCRNYFGNPSDLANVSFFVPAGPARLEVSNFGAGVLHSQDFVVTAGSTLDLGTVNVQLGAIGVSMLFNGAEVSTLGLAGCPLNVRLVRGTSTMNTNNCGGPSVIGNLPGGDYTASVLWGMPPNVSIGAPAAITVTGGATVSHTFDLSATTGLVKGTLTVNGQPPHQVTVCMSSPAVSGPVGFPGSSCTNFFSFPGSPSDGKFTFLAPAGAARLQVTGGGATLLDQVVEVAAGVTTQLGTIDAGVGDLRVPLLYKGQEVHTYAPDGCSMRLELQRGGTGVGGAQICFPPYTMSNLLPGDYVARLRWTMGSSQDVLTFPTQIVAGQVTSAPIELSEHFGILSGRVTINGQPPNNGATVCFAPSTFSGVTCRIYFGQNDGSFKFFVPKGCGDLTVNGGGELGRFTFCVEAGEDKDVGNPVEPDEDPEPTDNTAPVVTPTVTGTLGANGWYTSNVGVTWNATDAESPITSAPCVAGNVTSNTSGMTFTCVATSAGGSTTQSVVIKRDATAPVIAYTGNAGTYGVGDVVQIGCSASDATSGIASDTCADVSSPAYLLGAGTHTYSATAVDNAGNSSTASTSFNVTVTHAGICTLVRSFSSSTEVADGLCDKLEAARAAALRGQTKAAENVIAAFLNQLRAQDGKALTGEEAAILRGLVLAL